jgi:hypothetical protein
VPGQRYRKKPVEVEAIRFEIELHNTGEVAHFLGVSIKPNEWEWEELNNVFRIKTLEGRMLVRPGDWIIRGIQGEIYPCRDDIFRATYEPVEATVEP